MKLTQKESDLIDAWRVIGRHTGARIRTGEVCAHVAIGDAVAEALTTSVERDAESDGDIDEDDGDEPTYSLCVHADPVATGRRLFACEGAIAIIPTIYSSPDDCMALARALRAVAREQADIDTPLLRDVDADLAPEEERLMLVFRARGLSTLSGSMGVCVFPVPGVIAESARRAVLRQHAKQAICPATAEGAQQWIFDNFTVSDNYDVCDHGIFSEHGIAIYPRVPSDTPHDDVRAISRAVKDLTDYYIRAFPRKKLFNIH